MFDNIGGKIKGVAQFVTWLGIIASAIVFIILLMDEDTLGFAFAVLIVGCIGSWLSSLALYGFGQLIENSDIIAGRLSLEPLKKSNESNNQFETLGKIETTDARSFDELIDDLNLTTKQKANIEELREWKNDGLITTNDCRNRISKLLSDKPLELVMQLLNKI